ncbi:MAG: hypothetical protein ACJA0Y_000020 [Maricaulis maris]|jgi:hypothetical protein
MAATGKWLSGHDSACSDGEQTVRLRRSYKKLDMYELEITGKYRKMMASMMAE